LAGRIPRARGAAPPQRSGPSGSSRRIALYSHDTQGLGHIRRNIALAGALVAAEPDTDVLLLTGAPEATALPLPPRTDVVTLPTLCKDERGVYAARRLGAPLPQVLSLRSAILAAALTGFAPDLLVVDKVARGVHGELDAALTALREEATTVVLGLREVLDSPGEVRREWERAGTIEAIHDMYDAVWIYGDRSVYDLVAECRFPPEVAAKVAYTGYLGRGRGAGAVARSKPRVALPDRPYTLCLVGGGQDGLELADAFARSELPDGWAGIVVTGPYMPRRAQQFLRRLAGRSANMAVLDFVPDTAALIAGARSAVSMAGYNSVCELLTADCRTLLVPRTSPRTEQLIRARSLEERGLVDVLEPHLADPRRLARWIGGAATDAPRRRLRVDLEGLARVPVLARGLLAGAGSGACRSRREVPGATV
jgi:predicted glycosyltransferase